MFIRWEHPTATQMESTNDVGNVFTWPGRKYRSMQRSYVILTPYGKWRLVRDTVDFLLRLVGDHVVSDCKRNWLTPLAGLCALQYSFLTLYTAIYYWDKNKVTSIQPLTIMAIMIPVVLCCDMNPNSGTGRIIINRYRHSSIPL